MLQLSFRQRKGLVLFSPISFGALEEFYPWKVSVLPALKLRETSKKTYFFSSDIDVYLLQVKHKPHCHFMAILFKGSRQLKVTDLSEPPTVNADRFCCRGKVT